MELQMFLDLLQSLIFIDNNDRWLRDVVTKESECRSCGVGPCRVYSRTSETYMEYCSHGLHDIANDCGTVIRSRQNLRPSGQFTVHIIVKSFSVVGMSFNLISYKKAGLS